MCKDERDRLKAAQERAANGVYDRAAQSINAGYGYAEEGDKPADATPRIEGPPAVLARHAEMHRRIGMQLREQALKMLEESVGHLAAAGDLDAARRRILD